MLGVKITDTQDNTYKLILPSGCSSHHFKVQKKIDPKSLDEMMEHCLADGKSFMGNPDAFRAYAPPKKETRHKFILTRILEKINEKNKLEDIIKYNQELDEKNKETIKTMKETENTEFIVTETYTINTQKEIDKFYENKKDTEEKSEN